MIELKAILFGVRFSKEGDSKITIEVSRLEAVKVAQLTAFSEQVIDVIFKLETE